MLQVWSMRRASGLLVVMLALTVVLSGCSLLFGGGEGEEETPVAQEQDREVVPTFTPTPELPPTATPAQAAAEPTVVEAAPAGEEAGAEPDEAEESEPEEAEEAQPAEPAPTPTEAAPTPTPVPKLVVAIAQANVRNGPSTNYGLAGGVEQGQAFDIVGKNQAGTWWQFCCVNGQEAWIFGELVTAQDVGDVPVAQNIPPEPEPVAAAPTNTPPPPEPAEPEQPAEPEEPAEPEQPGGAQHAGPCGGDDGCKFRISRGPSKADNGGLELKIQAFFMHSGVEGGQPQGSYRIGLEKNGQFIEDPFANVTSIMLERQEGPMGPYNYETSIGASALPGGGLEGTYYFWVLDGNRTRDSEVFTLNLGPNEGEIWIEFDQG